MNLFRKTIYVILIVLMLFLALTAFLGGIGILTGINAPSAEQLEGSILKGLTIPGLSLFLVVGGSALFAAILLIRKSKFALLFSATAGIIIMFFEFVEILIIGSPVGIARNLQIFYFGLGTLIEIVSLGSWFLDLQSNPVRVNAKRSSAVFNN